MIGDGSGSGAIAAVQLNLLTVHNYTLAPADFLPEPGQLAVNLDAPGSDPLLDLTPRPQAGAR
jgi:hypothetical protein